MARNTAFAVTTIHQHRRIRRTGTVLAASLLAFLVWAVAVPWLGIDLVLGRDEGTGPIGPGQVVIVPLIAGAAAWAVLAMFEHRRGPGVLLWRVLGFSVLVLSLAGPVLMGATGAALATLLLEHLLVGTTLMIGLDPATAMERARSQE